MDAVKEASKFGIEEERAVRYTSDKKGTRKNYDVMSDVISEYRTKSVIGCLFKSRIEED